MKMNIYPTWWNTSVTLYNRQDDAQTDVVRWYRHNIDGTFWKRIKDKVAIGETVLETDKIICRLRKDESYMEKSEWMKLPNDTKSNYFTLGQGDIIAKGSVDDDINEYQSGHRSNDFLEKYKSGEGCFVVSTVVDNTGGGRGQEHYLVEGI
jgi:hypothetical protein